MQNPPFAPHFIHRFYKWVNRLPFSVWIFYPGLLLLLGFLAHTLVWRGAKMPVGEFDLVLLFSFAWIVEALALGHYVVQVSGSMLDAYRDRLEMSEKDYNFLHYEFTVIPAFWGTVYLLIGMGLGLVTSQATMQTGGSGAQFLSPTLTIGQWMISLGLGVMSTYFIVRQLKRLIMIFEITTNIPLNDMAPVYAFSR